MQGWTLEKWNNLTPGGRDITNPIETDSNFYASWKTIVYIDKVVADIGWKTTVGADSDTTKKAIARRNGLSYGIYVIKGIYIPINATINSVLLSGYHKHKASSLSSTDTSIHRFMIDMKFSACSNNELKMSDGGYIRYGEDWGTTVGNSILNHPTHSNFNNVKNPWFIIGGAYTDRKDTSADIADDDAVRIGNPEYFNPPNHTINLVTFEHQARPAGDADHSEKIIRSIEDANSCVVTKANMIPIVVVHKCIRQMLASEDDTHM